MRTNFSLVYISPCTFKCPIKITRQSSNSCDAGSHRCAGETTARLNCPETRWRTPCRSVGRTSTSLHDVDNAATPSTAASPPLPRITFLSLHSWDQRKPEHLKSRFLGWLRTMYHRQGNKRVIKRLWGCVISDWRRSNTCCNCLYRWTFYYSDRNMFV